MMLSLKILQEEDFIMKKIFDVMRELGVTPKYKGYYFVAEAVRLAMEFQDEPTKITKDIYPKLAKRYKSNTMNVEHDIRTVIKVAWTNRRNEMERMAGYKLNYKPTNSEFVDLLVCYLTQTNEEE